VQPESSLNTSPWFIVLEVFHVIAIMEDNEKHKPTSPKRAAGDNIAYVLSKKKKKTEIKRKSRDQNRLQKQLCKSLGVDHKKLDQVEMMRIIARGTEGFKRKLIQHCEADKPIDKDGKQCDPCWVEYEQISPVGQIELRTDSGKKTVRGVFARRIQSYYEKDESLKNMPYSRFLGSESKFASPHIVVLEECRLKREVEVQVGDSAKGTLRSVKQLTGIIEFDGNLPFFYSRDNQNKGAWLPKDYIAQVEQGCRAKRAPDRLTSDKIGNLTAKPTKYEDTTVPKNFEQVYKTMTTAPGIVDIVTAGDYKEAYKEANIRVLLDELRDKQTTSIFSGLKKLLMVGGDINRRRLLDGRAWYFLTPEDLRTTDENGEQRMYVDSDGNRYPYVPPKSIEEMFEEVGIITKYVRDWIIDNGEELMVAVKNKSEEEAMELVRKKVIENPTTHPHRPRRIRDSKQDGKPYHMRLVRFNLLFDSLRSGLNTIPEMGYTSNHLLPLPGYLFTSFTDSHYNSIATQTVTERMAKRNITKVAAGERKCQYTGGCATNVHPSCKQGRFCYHHSEKQKCSQCNKNVATRIGRLCNRCYKGDENEKVCVVCDRKVPSNRRRCDLCLTLKRSTVRQMRVVKQKSIDKNQAIFCKAQGCTSVIHEHCAEKKFCYNHSIHKLKCNKCKKNNRRGRCSLLCIQCSG